MNDEYGTKRHMYTNRDAGFARIHLTYMIEESYGEIQERKKEAVMEGRGFKKILREGRY